MEQYLQHQPELDNNMGVYLSPQKYIDGRDANLSEVCPPSGQRGAGPTDFYAITKSKSVSKKTTKADLINYIDVLQKDLDDRLKKLETENHELKQELLNTQVSQGNLTDNEQSV